MCEFKTFVFFHCQIFSINISYILEIGNIFCRKFCFKALAHLILFWYTWINTLLCYLLLFGVMKGDTSHKSYNTFWAIKINSKQLLNDHLILYIITNTLRVKYSNIHKKVIVRNVHLFFHMVIYDNNNLFFSRYVFPDNG